MKIKSNMNGVTLVEGLVVLVLFFVFVALIVGALNGSFTSNQNQYEHRFIDGIECLYDNFNQKVISCDWPPK